MTGLEKIISQIEEEARLSAEEIIKTAEDRAAEICAQAQETCRTLSQEAGVQAEAIREDILKKSRSAAQMERKKKLLAAKQQVIGQIIDQARDRLLALPDQEYFELIVKLAGEYAQSGDGEIRFNERYKNRLPQDFEQAICQAAARRGGSLALSQKTSDIDGGFVLVYGGIEENCSFEAMFAAQREKLQDQVHAFLFA